jgi:hypothetical protein
MTVRDAMRRVITAIAAARQDTLDLEIGGLDEFDIADIATEISDAKSLLDMGVQSPTLKRQVFKRLAMKYLSDARQDTKALIAQEIDANTQG